ncbi:glycoside hydrolase family 88/105 protein [Pseudoxanthomonas broegbernensis]|uniref:glycoside hydrolase family 88/105 protein n=1 Tax=Pseudoxanthomonas broegbernensis TaxID=83619 RepID=UPI0013912E9B|nr:glycoside hydrolase family 88 protein [Pseudoxanthomonas broegbernensis]MBB6066190.1 rhamnogalacturonyl hydrolase YesR [Pseudoxanthomonas broegbernensis]
MGTRLAQAFAHADPAGSTHYKLACAWYGSLAVAGLLHDRALLDALVAMYAPYRGSHAELLAGPGHVDDNVFGIVPLEIARQAGSADLLAEGLRIADHQRARIEAHKRFAIDDMFMITALQVQAWRASGDPEYLDTAAAAMVEYLHALQQDDGLFFHHADFRHKWARGNGWVAAGMTELLRELPPDHIHHAAIRAGYERMMRGLVARQIASGEDTGLWKQIVDSDDPRNWAETSGSAMFAYALITGVRNGWLDAGAYGPAARAGWLALAGRLTPDGELRDVSMWAYKPGSHPGGPDHAGDEENYYFQRPRLTGDQHGQAPMLWAAAALLR